MISISHWKKLSKSKPTDVWCLDSLGEHSIRFDRLSLCSQIKAIPIEDVVAMLEDLISEANELEDPKYILETSELPLDVDGTTLPLETYALQCYCRGGEEVIDIIEKKINELKGVKNEV